MMGLVKWGWKGTMVLMGGLALGSFAPSGLAASSVCADATLKLSTTATVTTREILAAVELMNPGSATDPLEDVVFDLRVFYGADGAYAPAPPGYFDIMPSVLESTKSGEWPHGNTIPPGLQANAIVRLQPTEHPHEAARSV